MKKRNPQTLLLMELTVCIMILCLAGSYVIKLYVASSRLSDEAKDLTSAVMAFSDIKELLDYSDKNTDKITKLFPIAITAEYSDGVLYETYYDTENGSFHFPNEGIETKPENCCLLKVKLTFDGKLIHTHTEVFNTENELIHNFYYTLFTTNE